MGAIQDKIDEILGIGTDKVSKAKLKELAELQNSTYNAIKTIVSNVRTSGTGAPGTTDTYTITYSDGTTSTFTVANGANGTGAIVATTRTGIAGQVLDSALLEKSLPYNVTNEVPLTAGTYYTATTARAAVPTGARALGKKITYATSAGVWVEETFVGSGVNGWTTVGNWENTTYVKDGKSLINRLFESSNFTTYSTTRWIGSDGNTITGGTTTICRKMQVTPGDIYLMSIQQARYGPVIRHGYALFSSYDTVNSTTFISGSGAVSTDISIFEEITIPEGCYCLAVSDYTTATTVSLIYIKSAKDQLNAIAKGVDAYDELYSKTLINYEQSAFGAYGGSWGVYQSEIEAAFKGVWANCEGNVRTKNFVFDSNRFGYINFYNSDLSIFLGAVSVDFNVNKYQLYPIYLTTEGVNASNVMGYCLLNPSKILTYMDGTAKYAMFNNSIEAYQKFISTYKIPDLDIVYTGDSLTAIGSGYSSYMAIYRYMNNKHGVGGETSLQICGRLGSIPFQIASDFTIPATITPVSISLKSSWNGNALFPRMAYSMNPCKIRGVEGTITVTTAGSACTFTRTTSGSETIVKSGETLITSESNKINNQILVLWLGQNGGWSDADDLVAQFESITDKNSTGKSIVITSHLATSSELESKMLKKYGSKYINMRDWTVKYGLSESGLTATQADLDAIALGNCPPQLLSDGIHFITAAKQAQAALIKRRLEELKYID